MLSSLHLGAYLRDGYLRRCARPTKGSSWRPGYLPAARPIIGYSGPVSETRPRIVARLATPTDGSVLLRHPGWRQVSSDMDDQRTEIRLPARPVTVDDDYAYPEYKGPAIPQQEAALRPARWRLLRRFLWLMLVVLIVAAAASGLDLARRPDASRLS